MDSVLADHIREEGIARQWTGSSFHAQQSKASQRSPPLEHSDYSKIVPHRFPHITRPGTSCMRPATCERFPAIGVGLQSAGQKRGLTGRARTPGPIDQLAIGAVWRPGHLMYSQARSCPTQRVLSCPAQLITHRASEAAVDQAPALSLCRTAMVHSMTARQQAGGTATPGLCVNTMATVSEGDQLDSEAERTGLVEADGGQQSQQLLTPPGSRPLRQGLSSFPVNCSDSHSSHSEYCTVRHPTEGMAVNIGPSYCPERHTCRNRSQLQIGYNIPLQKLGALCMDL
jgi:hypothetical protein